MKSENQIIVRCKQPIKIEKPLQCPLTFSYSVGERNIPQTVLLSFCFQFLFSQMPSKVITIVIQFMLLGINIFEALLRAHFNPCQTARARMSLSRAQNIFMPANINFIVLLNELRRVKLPLYAKNADGLSVSPSSERSDALAKG